MAFHQAALSGAEGVEGDRGGKIGEHTASLET